jgi:hypothetical protein
MWKNLIQLTSAKSEYKNDYEMKILSKNKRYVA